LKPDSCVCARFDDGAGDDDRHAANGVGAGEGEQNAPLGRAVIGGLIFATVSTLFFVPVVFSPSSELRPSRRRSALRLRS
jgi:hypothetical protein